MMTGYRTGDVRNPRVRLQWREHITSWVEVSEFVDHLLQVKLRRICAGISSR